jgi:terminase small subunit-like protein
MAARKGTGKRSKTKVAPETVAPDAPALPAAKPGAPLGNTNASKYTPELALEICSLIAECKTLTDCAEHLTNAGTPVSRRTILYWLDAHPEFAKMYARAHEMQADHDADEIRDIVRRVIGPWREGETPLGHQEARIAIDAKKWSAGKRQPKKYGERVQLDTPEDGPIAKAVSVTMAALAALAAPKP